MGNAVIHGKIVYEKTPTQGTIPKFEFSTDVIREKAFQVVESNQENAKRETEKAASAFINYPLQLVCKNQHEWQEWTLQSDACDYKITVFFAPLAGTYVSWVPLDELLKLKKKIEEKNKKKNKKIDN